MTGSPPMTPTSGGPRSPAGGSALVVRSSDDEADNPVLPVLVDEDGQPSGLGRALWTLVRRDGYDTALATLGRGGIWLRVVAQSEGEDTEGEQGMVVPGYGLHLPQDDIATLARIEEAMLADGVWWYVVERHGMAIDFRRDQERRQVSFVGWTDPEPAWSGLDDAITDQTSNL